jgi:hypothetical protein
MLSRLEKYKRKPFKKATIIIGALCLCIGLGGGVKTALADVDVQLLMANWFSKKQEASLKEIDDAIGLEKGVLMTQLKDQLQTEMKVAQEQLATFTAEQKQNRIEALQQYASKLKAGMKIDNSEQQAAILANLDAIINQARALMDGQVAELKLIPIPNPELPTTQEPVLPNPEVTPVPGSEESVDHSPKTEVNPEQEKSTDPKSELAVASPPEPVEVDIYTVSNWFKMPNLTNVTVEELSITGDVFSIDSTFSDILMNQRAKEILNSILVGIENHPQFPQIQYKTIEEMTRVAPGQFNEKVIYLLNKSLSTIKK